MGAGGHRPGAGRPPSPTAPNSGKSKKAPKGWRLKDGEDPTAEFRKLYTYAEDFRKENPGAGRMTAHELLMRQINDDDLPPAERRSAAGMILPYERPSLHRIDHRMNISITRPANELTDDELAAIASGATKLIEGSRVDPGLGGGSAAEAPGGPDIADCVYRIVDGVPAGEAPPPADRQAGETGEG